MDKTIGTIEEITAPERVGTSGITKQTLVIQAGTSNVLPIDFIGDLTEELQGLTRGQAVMVRYAVRGRRYRRQDGGTGYFVSLNGISVKPVPARTGNGAAWYDGNPEQPQPGQPQPAQPRQGGGWQGQGRDWQ